VLGSSWSFSPIRTVQTAWCSKNGCCICTVRKSSHLQAMQRAFQYRSPITSSIRDCFVGFLVGSYPCQAAKLVIILVSTWVYWVYGLPIILAYLSYIGLLLVCWINYPLWVYLICKRRIHRHAASQRPKLACTQVAMIAPIDHKDGYQLL